MTKCSTNEGIHGPNLGLLLLHVAITHDIGSFCGAKCGLLVLDVEVTHNIGTFVMAQGGETSSFLLI